MLTSKVLRALILLTLTAGLSACGDDDRVGDDAGVDASDAALNDAIVSDAGSDTMTPDVSIDGGVDSAVDAGTDAPATCDDGTQNGDETDTDCGGSCDACADGLMCGTPADCESGVCTGGVCAAPTCGDGVVNGTDVCDPMAAGMECCLMDCSGAAPMGTACGMDPDAEGCMAAPACTGMDATSASCVAMMEMDGTSCTDDGVFCNGAEVCMAGTCTAAGDPCSGADGDDDCAETCDEAAGACTGQDPDGSACDDGLFCTGADSCAAGVCAGAGDPCPGPDNDGDCAESCDEAGGTCTGPDVAGSACDDGAFCTVTDACDGVGMCAGSGSPCAADMTCSVDSCLNRTVYYFGDFVTNGVDELASYDPVTAMVSSVPLMGLASASDIREVAFSEDSSLIAVSGRLDNASPSFVNVYDADAPGAPVTIADSTLGANASVEFKSMRFSPDGTMLAFTADLERNGADTLYVASVAGGSPPLRLSPAPTGNQDVKLLRWVGNTHIVFIGDVVTDDVDNAYAVDVMGASPLVPLVTAPLSSTQDVSSFGLGVDTSMRIYFMSDHVVDDVFVIYGVALDGTGLAPVPGTQLMQTGGTPASARTFSLSPDRTRMAFIADAPTPALREVYVVALGAAAGAVRVSDFSTTVVAPGTSRGPSFAPTWSPDGSFLAVVADWGITDNDNAAFVLPTTGPAAGVRVVGPSMAAANQDVIQVAFSSDGAYLFARGDIVTNNDTELFVTADFATADQDATMLRFETVPTSGDVAGFAVRP